MNSSPDELQFDRAEYAEQSKPAPTCTACREPVTDAYYEIGGKMVCPNCHAALNQALSGGSRFARFFRALGGGLAGGAVGAGIYFAVLELTGYEVGVVAIVVGFLVGGGVRWGARRRGGWVYQGMAMSLTYLAIVATYVPMVFREMRNYEDKAATEEVAKETRQVAKIKITGAAEIELNGEPVSFDDLCTELQRLKHAGGVVWYYFEGYRETPAPPVADQVWERVDQLELPYEHFKDGEFQHPRRVFGDWDGLPVLEKVSVVVAVLVTAFIIPWMGLPENIIGILIIAFGVYQAWRMNKRLKLGITGPYQIAAPPTTDGQPTTLGSI